MSFTDILEKGWVVLFPYFRKTQSFNSFLKAKQ